MYSKFWIVSFLIQFCLHFFLAIPLDNLVCDQFKLKWASIILGSPNQNLKTMICIN